MPHVIEVQREAGVRFPDVCPFCTERPADTTMVHRFQKAVGGIPGIAVRYQWSEMPLPLCSPCARYFRVSIRAGTLMAVVPLLVAFVLVMTNVLTPWIVTALAVVSSAGVLAGMAIGCWRVLRLRRFRVGYFNDRSVLFFTSSQRYAAAFARANGVTAEQRLFVFRWR